MFMKYTVQRLIDSLAKVIISTILFVSKVQVFI